MNDVTSRNLSSGKDRRRLLIMSTSSSIAAYLSVILTGLLALSVLMVFRFAEKGFPFLTYFTLTIGYFVSFGIILLVPIDIAAVVEDRKSKLTGNDPEYDSNVEQLSGAYSTFFVSVLVLGSFVLVFEEYYNTDGTFICLCCLCVIWHFALLSLMRLSFE